MGRDLQRFGELSNQIAWKRRNTGAARLFSMERIEGVRSVISGITSEDRTSRVVRNELANVVHLIVHYEPAIFLRIVALYLLPGDSFQLALLYLLTAFLRRILLRRCTHAESREE